MDEKQLPEITINECIISISTRLRVSEAMNIPQNKEGHHHGILLYL